MKTDLSPSDLQIIELVLADVGGDGLSRRRFFDYYVMVNGPIDPFVSDSTPEDSLEALRAAGLVVGEVADLPVRVIDPDPAPIPTETVDLDDLVFDDEPIELAPVEVAAPQKAAKPRQKSPAGDPSLGKGQVPWRSPGSQAEHMKAIRESHPLKKNARLVAFEAHVQLGITSAVENQPFPTVKRELTSSYLAMLTGLSDKAVRLAMAEVVRLGFLRRIDNGKGGRNKANKATYMAVVPEWTS